VEKSELLYYCPSIPSSIEAKVILNGKIEAEGEDILI
jgi:hypothetical protein